MPECIPVIHGHIVVIHAISEFVLMPHIIQPLVSLGNRVKSPLMPFAGFVYEPSNKFTIILSLRNSLWQFFAFNIFSHKSRLLSISIK